MVDFLLEIMKARRQWSYIFKFFMKKGYENRWNLRFTKKKKKKSATKMLKIQAYIRYIFYLFLIILKANWWFKAKIVKMYYVYMLYNICKNKM